MGELTLIGGPTALVEYGGLRWLTDPTLSAPGEQADGLTRTTPPALEADALGHLDVVLLSHDEHSDNLDAGGREFLPRARRVLTTTGGAERLAVRATGMAPWSTDTIDGVQVTAVPALHGPPGCEPETGEVIGFVLDDGATRVYVSGDNASVDVVREIGERAGPIDVAILFAGAVQIPEILGGAYLTLSSDRAAHAAEILGAREVIPLHFEGWTHFTQGAEQLRASFAGYGLTERLRLPERGVPLSF
ncbi:MAG TPA: MBL fold metallo-hydrolase [Solirubrobacteraceae bacterium]|nr:MBL fold metallo-hydrolase [Solirubrobacteraceae bacterium]